MDAQMNPENIEALIEAQARGEMIPNEIVDKEAAINAELDSRVSKLASSTATSSGTIQDAGISSEVVLAHELTHAQTV